MQPLVSIIITNYNYGRFLGEAIDSALAQTWPNKEVIVLDDESRDDSIEVACRYPVTVLAQKNRGLSLARNNALTQASGEYVIFLDADDRLVPTAVEHLMARLAQAPADIAYAYGQMRYFGERDGLFASGPFDARRLAKANYICATTLLRKDVLLAAGGYDNAFRKLREDWELYLRLCSKGYQGVFLPEVVLENRKHKGATVGTSPIKAHSIAMLIKLYPGMMWAHLLKHPWRYGSRLLFGKLGQEVAQHGDQAEQSGLRVVQRAGATDRTRRRA
ncbi:MAG: glycosyltransferase family A protein [Thauera sp.]|jgi:glycosyltransferase involved in cell wall biosynthesis